MAKKKKYNRAIHNLMNKNQYLKPKEKSNKLNKKNRFPIL